MPANNADHFIWERFKSGDRASFAEIYKNYAPVLISYGHKITSDVELIEDSIQDLFVELWKSRERLSSTNSIKFYLFKALRLKIYRNLSNGATMNSLDSSTAVLQTESREHFIIQIEAEFLQTRQLMEVLGKLPPRQQEAINLRYLHDFTNDEIAAIMGISYNSACKTLYAGLKNLKENMKEAFIHFN